MSISHTHHWVEHARTWAPPVDGIAKFSGGNSSARAVLLGLTTFVFHCRDEQCGALRKIEALGKVVEAPK